MPRTNAPSGSGGKGWSVDETVDDRILAWTFQKKRTRKTAEAMVKKKSRIVNQQPGGRARNAS